MTKRKRKNPVPPSQVAHAGHKYRAFSGHEPESIGSVRNPLHGARAVWVLGELDAVDYTTVRDGKIEHYRHEFKKHARPLLAVTHDGRNLVIVEGRYTVTDAGITDSPRSKSKRRY